MATNVREVIPADALWPQVAGLFRDAVSWLTDEGDDGDYHFFVATDENGVLLGASVIDIGTLALGPLSDVAAGFLESIEVLKPHRRKGVGAKLLRATLEHAWQAGCESVRSTVDYGNHAAIALYRQLGFVFIPDEDPDAAEPNKTYTIVAINPARVK